MHVDDYIASPVADAYAAFMLHYFRLPAIVKLKLQPTMKEQKLFCTRLGNRYRVTGASRLGDVWLAWDLNREVGYNERVNIKECTDWSDQP